MKNKDDKEEDLFKDERVTVSLIGEIESPLGKILITRDVSGATAKKILRLISATRQVP